MDRKSSGGSRKKKVTGNASGGGVFKRGSGVSPAGNKPVGNAGGYTDRKQGGTVSSGGPNLPGSTGGQKPPGGGFSFPSSNSRAGTSEGSPIGKLLKWIIILVIAYILFQSCTNMFSESTDPGLVQDPSTENTGAAAVIGDPSNNNINPSTGITGPRTRRTEILGGGADVFTIMIYMCGTDLETTHGMATADLNEMLHATISDQVNIIVETGGTSRWKNSVIKNTTNQRYQVTSSGLRLLQDNLGK
ncbi:MAG: hypothetical protein U1E11_08335 [Dethiobacteria bacterium]|nr:hypothetical protein [Dethiobacteria bacterium]